MRGILNIFSRKGGNFKPQPGAEVEVEWTDPQTEEILVVFATIHEVQKKKLTLQTVTPVPSRLGPGAKVRLCSLDSSWFYAYQANVHSCSGQLLEVSLPTGDQLETHQIPTFDEAEKIDFVTTVDYRASRSPYNQVAEVVAVGRQGLTLQTNMSIPSQTPLELSLRLPNRSQPLTSQVKTVRSVAAEGERKKFLAEVEFVETGAVETLWTMALRNHLRTSTRTD